MCITALIEKNFAVQSRTTAVEFLYISAHFPNVLFEVSGLGSLFNL